MWMRLRQGHRKFSADIASCSTSEHSTAPVPGGYGSVFWRTLLPGGAKGLARQKATLWTAEANTFRKDLEMS